MAVLAVAALAPHDAGAAPPIAEGRILLKPAAGLSDDKLAKILEKAGARAGRKLHSLSVRIVEVPRGKEVHFANALSRQPNVAFAEPDALVEPVAVVNDPNYGSQWHLPLIGAPSAWQYANGNGVTVAICDTGVNGNHPDLAGQVVAGWNTAANSTDTSDVHGHGTWVSGVVAEAANNLVGGASVAPGARIMMMRITDRSDGYAYFSDMAECVTWAADHGARVANISYGGVPGSATVAGAASYMMNKGGLVVVAAGNDGADRGYDNSPYLLTAAATVSADTRASYSNYGGYVDVAAPGSGIFTTDRGGGYASVSGTSFASPNTAAVAALVMSANPALTPTDVTAIIANTAKDLGSSGWDPYYGHGRVDAFAATQMAASVETSDTTPPAVEVASPASAATVKDLVTVDVQATDAFGVSSVELLADGSAIGLPEYQEVPNNPGLYRFSWDSTEVSDGSHRLTARATDAAGNIGSDEVTVNVANVEDSLPPSVVITSPGTDAVVSGSMIMSASASDNTRVASITISANGQQCSGVDSVSCSVSLRKFSGSQITVYASATDVAGNRADTSRTVLVAASSSTKTNRGKSARTATDKPGNRGS